MSGLEATRSRETGQHAVVSRWVRLRILIFGLVVLVLLAVVIFRGYHLQAVEGPRLREMAEQQYLKKVELPPRRGTIFDRHGTPLAVSVEVDSVYANARKVGDRAAAVARELSEVLELDSYTVQKALSSRRFFVWIKRRISPQAAAQVRQLKIKGIYLTKESRRFYPNHGLGSSVVGFSGLDGKGLEGIELSMDAWLRGSSTRVTGLRDALGRSVLSQGTPVNADNGHDVHLTIDKFIQLQTEQVIAEAYKNVRKKGWVAAVVMDPRSGDILAMASAPSFNPNQFGKSKPSTWRNRALTDTFEPGSTLKIFTVGAAMDAGVVRPGEVFNCEKGAWRLGRFVIHDSHAYVRLDLAGVLVKSSNIAAAKIGFRMGKERLYRRLRRFGFGARTGVGIRGERSGVLRKPKRWSDVGLANIAFGQGMTTTVLQLSRALTAVGNDGVMMTPRLVSRVVGPRKGKTDEFAPSGTRVLSAATARRLRRMLVGVTEKGGTAEDAALERYSVAGKTGTAQKVDPVTRSYAQDLYVASFIGVVPASRPRLVISVVVNEPEGEKHYGGDVAGPLFARIAKKSLRYLGVAPDRKPSAVSAKKALARKKGSRPTDGHLTVAHDPAPPLPGEGGPPTRHKVPDFTGMSIAEVISLSRTSGLEVRLIGSGQAVGQSPGPGPVKGPVVCRVSFRPPG